MEIIIGIGFIALVAMVVLSWKEAALAKVLVVLIASSVLMFVVWVFAEHEDAWRALLISFRFLVIAFFIGILVKYFRNKLHHS